MDGLLAFLLFFGLPIAGAVWLWRSREASRRARLRRREELAATLEGIAGFDPRLRYLEREGLRGLAIDEQQALVCLLAHGHDDRRTEWERLLGDPAPEWRVSYRLVAFRDVLSAELHEDGDTVVETSRLSQAGGAVVGGLLFGTAGAVVGGLSGKQRQTGTVNQIELRVVVKDPHDPIHDVTFYASEAPLERSTSEYREVAEVARTWQARMAVVIQAGETNDADGPGLADGSQDEAGSPTTPWRTVTAPLGASATPATPATPAEPADGARTDSSGGPPEGEG